MLIQWWSKPPRCVAQDRLRCFFAYRCYSQLQVGWENLLRFKAGCGDGGCTVVRRGVAVCRVGNLCVVCGSVFKLLCGGSTCHHQAKQIGTHPPCCHSYLWLARLLILMAIAKTCPMSFFASVSCKSNPQPPLAAEVGCTSGRAAASSHGFWQLSGR